MMAPRRRKASDMSGGTRQANGTEDRARLSERPILVPRHGHGALRPFPKGVSGNPGGKGGQLREAQKLAREATPKAVKRLIDMLDSDDDRVVVIAANSLWEKAGGKVLENAPELEPEKRLDLSKLSLPELKFLLKIVRTCKVGAEVVPIGSGADVMD